VRFADDHALIAGAPLFDRNFGSWVSEPGIVLGGYRGLAGKEIGADEFVERIVEQYRGRAGDVERFHLYARQWVEAMTRIAPEGKSRIRRVTVPRIGHSSAGLTPACQRALAESLGGS